MALSWSELSDDQKIVDLIESLPERQDQETPIGCTLCDQIFYDNRSLVNHFQSHFHRDGTFNPRPLVGSSMPPENGTNFFSSSSQYTHSLSVPMNVHTTANENLSARPWQTFAPNPPNLLQGNYLSGTLSQNSVQLRGPTLAHRPQSYQLPSILRSAASNGTFASPPNISSNFYSRFVSQLTGPQNFRSPIRPISPGIVISQTTQQSNFHLPVNPGTSASQTTTQLSNFHFPMNPGASASQTTQPANFPFPITPGASASQTMQRPNFHFPMNSGASASQTAEIAKFHFLVNPGTSTSQPIQQSSFPTVQVGTFAAQSIPGTSGLASNTAIRNLPQNAMGNEVEGPSTGYTKPYIAQLEQPIAEIVEDHSDMDGDVNHPDAVDLTLKL